MISKELHLHLVFMEEKFCCFGSPWTPFEARWIQVISSASLHLCAGLSVRSVSFTKCQKLRNCNLCLLMRTSSACNKSTSSWVWNFPLYRVISPAQSFLPALWYLIWSCPRKPGLKPCTVLGDGPPRALQGISTSAAIGKGLRLVLQVGNNVLLSSSCKSQHSQGEMC